MVALRVDVVRSLWTFAVLMLVLSKGVAAPDPRFGPDPDGAAQGRLAVEQLLVRAYEKTLEQTDFPYSASQLVNAPISGKTNRRGRHLLSFSAFNQFPLLAGWALDHGANINLGDKDAANMLRMSLGNYNAEMARFALEHDANPNMLMGEGSDTMLSGLIKWKWPAAGFFLARDFGARPRTEEERQKILEYIKGLPKEDLVENIGFFERYVWRVKYLEEYLESVPLAEELLPEAGRAELIEISMVDVMDKALLDALKTEELSERAMEQFYVKGKGFEAFLAFNGFTQTLVERLGSMSREKAVAAVNRLDVEGNDLLVAAIKSLNSDAVEAVLNVTSERVNAQVSSDMPWHYSKGQRPLHIAIQWNVPVRIFELLVGKGADPEMKNGSGTSARWLLEYYTKNWDAKELGRIRVILKPKPVAPPVQPPAPTPKKPKKPRRPRR